MCLFEHLQEGSEGYEGLGSVKHDVRYLGGLLDTTFCGWSATLTARVRLVISRLVLIFVLRLDFHCRVRVVRSMYLPAALHGIEASLLNSESLRKLRSSIRRVVWSRRQPLASVGAVLLACWMGPLGATLLFAWFGLGFACFVAISLFGLQRWVGCIVCLRWLVKVVLGMVLFIFLLPALLRLVFNGTLMLWLGLDLVNFCLVIQLALFSISKLLFLMLGVVRFLLIFAVGRVFVVGLCLMFTAPCNFLTLLMSGKEIRLCFGALWLGVSGMVSFLCIVNVTSHQRMVCFLDGFGARLFHVGFVGLLIMMVIYFGNVPFFLLLRFGEILSFMIS